VSKAKPLDRLKPDAGPSRLTGLGLPAKDLTVYDPWDEFEGHAMASDGVPVSIIQSEDMLSSSDYTSFPSVAPPVYEAYMDNINSCGGETVTTNGFQGIRNHFNVLGHSGAYFILH
jgi:hypothetical protein